MFAKSRAAEYAYHMHDPIHGCCEYGANKVGYFVGKFWIVGHTESKCSAIRPDTDPYGWGYRQRQGDEFTFGHLLPGHLLGGIHLRNNSYPHRFGFHWIHFFWLVWPLFRHGRL